MLFRPLRAAALPVGIDPKSINNADMTQRKMTTSAVTITT